MLGEMSSPWRERAKRAFPGMVQGVRLCRLLRNQVRYPIAATVLDMRGTVLAGPFAGLRCLRSGGVGGYWEMLGTYEQSLHPVIEHIVEHPPPAIVVVGAATTSRASRSGAPKRALWPTRWTPPASI